MSNLIDDHQRELQSYRYSVSITEAKINDLEEHV